MTKLGHQTQFFQLPGVFRAGGHEIDSGGIDGGMAQNVRQLDDIPADFIEYRSEQVPEIVREDLGRFYPGLGA